MKSLLNNLVNTDLLDLTDGMHRFASSVVTMGAAEAGMEKLVRAWNSHLIPWKGVSDVVAQCNNRTGVIDPCLVPSTDEAVIWYEETGGRLTRSRTFGDDLLHNVPALQLERDRLWLEASPTFDQIFSDAVSGTGTLFKGRILAYAELTQEIATQHIG